MGTSKGTTRALGRLLRATIVGGLVFLLPLVLVAILLGQAIRLAGRVMQPVTASLDVDKLVGPVGVLVVALAAGLVARTALGPVLVSIEDGWQIGYLIEEMDSGWVAVFLPQAPAPLSGNVMYMPIERTRPLGITMAQAMIIVKNPGTGSATALRGGDFALPGSVGTGAKPGP